MEAEKRKREDDGKMNGKEEGVLKGEVSRRWRRRRIHVAVKYFEKSEGKKWRPLLEREDFKELDGADLDTEKKEVLLRSMFDLECNQM
uniref:Uncharacterized protein n=1 Tax=Salix viminalis TaxID=40686 RepID=A0A6N2N3R5_SALVM